MGSKIELKSRKVLLAFSGGTDSVWSAVKLSSAGYRVEALVLDMTGDGRMIENARTKASAIGITCRVLDVRNIFRQKVIDYFTAEYLAGRTPAPCTLCNPLIKWKTLYETAVQEGFDHIATGHYFRTVEAEGRHYIARAADPVKDQSYYLWMLPQEILAMALTPMGDEIKKDVVERAAAPVSRESMGVCFLEGRDYRDYIRERCGGHPSCLPGDITDSRGTVIGRHEGCAFYTIGQKKGLGLPAGYAVTGIHAPDNCLTTGSSAELLFSHIILEKYLIDGPDSGTIPEVKLRGYGINPPGGCSYSIDDGRMTLVFEEPVWAPAKGQPVVFYDGELVTGGGFISGFY